MANTDLISAIAQPATDILGMGMGIAMEGHNDKRQIRQQQALTDIQTNAQNAMTDYNMKKQLEMWQATGYEAQMEQLKKAGLNPGLLYGKGGGGGQTANVATGSATGGQAQQNPGEMQQYALMGANMGLINAQTENVKADTQKKKVEVPNIETQTESLTQGIQNQKAVEAMTKAQTIMQNMQNEITKNTKTEQEDLIVQAAASAKEITMQQERQTFIDRATANAKVDIILNQSIGAMLQNQALVHGIKLTDQQIKESIAKISQGWSSLDIQSAQVTLNNWIAEQEKSNPSIWNVIGGAMKSGVHKLAEALGQKPDDSGFKPPKRK